MGCPNEYCRSVVPAVRLFDLFAKGVLPISGGALDQSAWFIDAERFFRVDELVMKAESEATNG